MNYKSSCPITDKQLLFDFLVSAEPWNSVHTRFALLLSHMLTYFPIDCTLLISECSNGEPFRAFSHNTTLCGAPAMGSPPLNAGNTRTAGRSSRKRKKAKRERESQVCLSTHLFDYLMNASQKPRTVQVTETTELN